MKRWVMCFSVAVVSLGALSAVAAGQGPAEHDSPRLRISFEEFTRLYRGGEVLVIDVRDEASFRTGHLPGAVSMPLKTLEQHLDRLRGERRAIVTYCT